ncbi:MAG: TlpA family protein disulfide reductase [Gammaproteobacteria bacterium]|nr:TlpA family protein disulfide reductase [Gammaproteobacteria bacterium]
MIRSIIALSIIYIFPLQASAVDIPHVSLKAKDSFQFDYLYANKHRAFTIAPGGAWSWTAGKATEEEAKKVALDACNSYTQQKCVLYAVNEQITFDPEQWYGLWGPYKTKAEGKDAKQGIKVGEIFPDVTFTNPQGLRQSISELKDKVVFIHFWGCWCPPCRREFETLIDMYRILQDTMVDQVAFVVLQLREPIETARAWAKQNNLDALPLSDSGVKNSEDKFIRINGGKQIADREIAKFFPSTYVIDKNGYVIFSHMGSVENWPQYVPFFRDAVENSGK